MMAIPHWWAISVVGRSSGKLGSTLPQRTSLTLTLTYRVALARAVYGKFDTYVLDDVLSALDATTEAHVFAALFGSRGLLKGKSVIMATNQVYRLPQASFVTCLDGGRVAEQGSYEELVSRGGILADLVAEFSSGEKAEKSAEVEAIPNALTEEATDARSEKEEEAETSAKGGVGWSNYLCYLKAMGTTNAAICECANATPTIHADEQGSE